MDMREPLWKDSTSTLREERTRELEDLGLDRPNGREEDSDDRDIPEFLPEKFLCEGEDDIGIIFRDLGIRESEEDNRDKYEEKYHEKDHGPEGRSARSDMWISSFFREIECHIPSIVEKYRDQRSLDKGREIKGKGIEPIPREGVHRSEREMGKSEDNDQQEDDRFDNRQDDLCIARELDPF